MLDSVYSLAIINMVIFIALFFMLMNKTGYTYRCKTNIQLILILILSLICKITYQINIKKATINSVIYSLLYILIGCSIYWILQFSWKYVGHYILKVNTVINFIVIFIGVYFFDILHKIYNNKKYYLYIILTIAVNVVIVLFLNISTEKMEDLYTIVTKNHIEYSYNVYTMYFSLFMKNTFPYILFIVNVLLISIFINSIKSEKEKIKAEFVSEKLDMQYKYYFTVKESQEKMRQVYHDMNNHMKNIKSLKNSSEDVNKYIDGIEDEVKNTKNIYNTGNVLLDIILYEKSRLCMENNIDFNVGIDFSKCEFIEMIDVSSIFS
ncbi:TPA: ATP-binding protein, partial [Clostridioides difficile]|nr:ATP-binding protein [Clostridioides difficile]